MLMKWCKGGITTLSMFKNLFGIMDNDEEVIEEEKVAEPVNPLGKFGIQVQDRYEDI